MKNQICSLPLSVPTVLALAALCVGASVQPSQAQNGVARVPGGAMAQLKIEALPRGVTRAQLEAHEVVPANIRGVESFRFDGPRTLKLVPQIDTGPQPKININTFGAAIHNTLKDQVNGYTLRVRKGNQVTYNLIWNWAKRPGDGSQGWTGDTRMHIASVSKLMTAMGVAKALDMKGLSYDTKIINYLPSHWSKGPKINQITFRHLLNQTSGFDTGDSSTDYETMKKMVAKGVPKVGDYAYANMNCGLCRILIPILMGTVKKDAQFFPFGSLNDKLWDAITVSYYREFMQDRVFEPSGVNNADFKHVAGVKSAMAYKFPAGDGWDSGNLSSVAGGAGWRLSIDEVLKVMATFRGTSKILSPAKAQYCLDNYFGLDQIIDSPAGKIYNKNGLWRSNGRTEQCVAYFLPDNTQVAVFVNSPVGADSKFLRSLINTALTGAIK